MESVRVYEVPSENSLVCVIFYINSAAKLKVSPKVEKQERKKEREKTVRKQASTSI